MNTTFFALGLVFGYLFVAATLGSILAWLLHGVVDFEYIKILSRGILLFAAIGLVPLWRIAGLSAADLQLLPVNVRQLVKSYPLGLLIVAPLILLYLVSGFRVFDDRVDYGGSEIWIYAVTALLSGLLVGVFEETLFRGVLFGVLRRSVSFFLSACIVGVLYASVHFLDAEPLAGYSHCLVHRLPACMDGFFGTGIAIWLLGCVCSFVFAGRFLLLGA